MTSYEFDTWYAKIFGPSFLSVFRWVEKESPDTAATLRSWYEQLKHLTVIQLNDALALIQSGAEDLGQWQDIPRTLARIARERSFAETTKEPSDLWERRERCATCHDRGLVLVWDVDTMRMARWYVGGHIKIERIKWYEAGIACTCEAGGRFATWKNWKGDEDRPRFDKESWLRCSGDREEAQGELIKWAQDYQPPNYSDFGSYS